MVFLFHSFYIERERALSLARSTLLAYLIRCHCVWHIIDTEREWSVRVRAHAPPNSNISFMCIIFEWLGERCRKKKLEKKGERAPAAAISYSSQRFNWNFRFVCIRQTPDAREREENRRTWESHTSQQHLPKVFFFPEFCFHKLFGHFFFHAALPCSRRSSCFLLPSRSRRSLSLALTSLLLFALLI